MTPRRSPIQCYGVVVLAMGMLAGCAAGPFTKPARVTLYEERQAADPAASSTSRAPAPTPVTAAPSSAPVTAAPSPAPVTTAAPTRTEQPSRPSTARYSGEHTVRSGETVYSVAGLYRVPIRGVIELNGLQAPYELRPGQVLRIPVPRDHIVQPGDTLYGISRTYGVAMNALVRLNDIPPPYTIVVGRSLRLPEPVETAAEPAGDAPEGTLPRPSSVRPSPSGNTVSAPVAASKQARVNPAVPKPQPRSGRTFLLPVRGRILSDFGSKGRGLHNDGVNIEAERGTPVRAAENGIVVYAGNALLGFGNMILLRHADGFMTAYAHTDTMNVRRGDAVRRGQVIATVGSTGNVSTPQLHFEVRKGKSAVNPAQYLPGLAGG